MSIVGTRLGLEQSSAALFRLVQPTFAKHTTRRGERGSGAVFESSPRLASRVWVSLFELVPLFWRGLQESQKEKNSQHGVPEKRTGPHKCEFSWKTLKSQHGVP